MRILRRLRLRLRSLLCRDRFERELNDELAFHLDELARQETERGRSAEAAASEARRLFGGVAQWQEQCRDMRRVGFVEHRLQDLRFAIRQLARYRGFASAAIVVPALGIAASVAIFGFVDAALIRPMPYTEPSRLVTVFGTRPDLVAARNRGSVSYLDLLDWQTRSRAFGSLAAYDVRAGFLLETATDTEFVPGVRVTSGYVPFNQPVFTLVVRMTPSAPTFVPMVRAAIHETRPGALIGELETFAERANRLPSTSLNRSTAWLTGAFAAIACVLSVVGLYGVVAYSVGQRTREIGLRVALGASHRLVYRLVMGEALRLAGLGTIVGIVGAVMAARLMRRLLFEVSSSDPLILLSSGLVLVLAALLASYFPARRAASIDPITVLRTT